MEENKENKRRAVILTIIAIATMAVVLVGATFAYLASTRTEKASTNITATTSGGDTIFMINSGKDISVVATEENLNATDPHDVSDYSTGKLTLMGASASSVDYSVHLFIEENDFEYSSGTCYDTPSESAKLTMYTTKTDCASESNTLWIGESEESGACYNIGALTVDTTNTNSLLCANVDKIWVAEEVAELVIDLYKADNDKLCGTTAGVCVDNKNGRALVEDVDNQSDCENTGDRSWLANIEENGICYSWVTSKDITEIEESTDENGIELYNNSDKTYVAVTKTINEDNDYYYAEVTMRNLDHNQVLNGAKTFKGKLIYLNDSLSE